jgi:hypothetical protein
MLIQTRLTVFNLLSAASAAAARGSECGVTVVLSFDWAAVLPNTRWLPECARALQHNEPMKRQ